MKQNRNKKGQFLPRHNDKEISIIDRALTIIREAKTLDFKVRNRIADYLERAMNSEIRREQ